MDDEFDTSVDTSSFDDTGSDFSDTSSFDTSTDVGEIMDDSSFEVADTLDESDFSDYDMSGDMSEVDDLMSDTSDEYIETLDTSDLDSDVSEDDSEGIESLMDDTATDEFSEVSDTLEETDLGVESDIVDLMDEAALESTDETVDVSGEELDETDEISELMDEGGSVSIDETVESLEETGVVEDLSEDTTDDIESLMNDSGEEVADITEETGDIQTEIEEQTSDVSNLMEDTDEPVEETSDITDESMEELVEETDPVEDMAEETTNDITDDITVDVGDNDSLSDSLDSIEDDVSEVASDLTEVDTSGETMYLTQDEFESILGSSDRDALERLCQGVESGNIQVCSELGDTSDDIGEGPALTRDANEQWEIGNNAIENNVEAMRDDLRDKGLEDGPQMEAIVMRERARMQEELQRNIDGDFSDPYVKPDFDEVLANGEFSDETLEADNPLDVETPIVDAPAEIDYDAVYGGLDEYDFDGIDYSIDTERLDASLDNFESDTWEQLSVDEQKNAMSDLADYVEEVIGFDNPPEIVYYNNPVEGDYGGYSPSTNTLEVNEYMLYNNEEAADTVAHELWHAYQHQRALNPQSAKDYQYQYGFDNYIRPEDDFSGYQDQLVEAEARAFAQQFKDRLNTKGRRI